MVRSVDRKRRTIAAWMARGWRKHHTSSFLVTPDMQTLRFWKDDQGKYHLDLRENGMVLRRITKEKVDWTLAVRDMLVVLSADS